MNTKKGMGGAITTTLVDKETTFVKEGDGLCVRQRKL